MASTPTTFDTDCKLMLHMDGADASTTFTDSSSSKKTMTVNGNAQIDTAQSKFGGASGLFDGTTDYVYSADSDDWHLADGDFTIDFWIRWNSLPSAGANQSFINQWTVSAGNKLSFLSGINNTAGTYSYVFYWSEDTTSVLGGDFRATTVSTATWYHVAIIRNGTILRWYQDGTQVGADISIGTSSLGNTTVAPLVVGALNYSATWDFNGWIDELRFVKGTAVWTANFTPPTKAYVPANSSSFFMVM